MRSKDLLCSTPVRVGLALIATALIVFGIASLGSGPDPSDWISELSAGPSASGIRGDTSGIGLTTGSSGGRLTSAGKDAGSPDAGSVSDKVDIADPGNGDSSGASTIGAVPRRPGKPIVPENPESEDPKPGGPSTPDNPGTPGDEDSNTPVKTIRILWWNDTRSRAPRGFEVAIGAATWRPSDESAERETGALKRIPVGEPIVLYVYPDGRSNQRFEVPIEVTEVMQSDSDQDAIHVAVSDTAVRVVGTPVVEFDVSFKRE